MKWVFFIFSGLYVTALFVFITGTFGWFGQERDPLSGIFLLPLGAPWNFLADSIGVEGPWPAIIAPALNAAILFWFWRR